jgi:hypothetical protein
MIILEIVGAAVTALSKLIAAGDDADRQEEALMDLAEASKRGLDYVKFGRKP